MAAVLAKMGEPILLLFGVGKNIGGHTVSTFKSKGYRVAQAARSLKSEDSTDNLLSIPCDLSKPAAVSDVFKTVREKWGEPNVVAYNGKECWARPCVHPDS